MELKIKITTLLKNNEVFLNKLGVARLGLFGSVVRGEAKATSDVDFVVEFLPGKKNYDNYIDLCFFLEDNLGLTVDLLTPEGISPIIRERVNKEVEYVQIAS